MPTLISRGPKQRADTAATYVVADEDQGDESLGGVFGFSILGLLFACILSLLSMNSDYAALVFPLIFFCAPIAALLGVGLGQAD